MDRPGGTQQVMEILLTNSMGLGIQDLLDDVVGHGSEKFLPMIGTISIFILMSNLLALIPGFMSPTAEVTVPLGCATVIFLYYNSFGIGKHGARGYAKTLLGSSAGNFADHGDRRNRQPLCEGAFADRSILGEHDGQRVDFRYFFGPFHQPFFVCQPFESGRVYCSSRAHSYSIGVFGFSHFRSDLAGVYFYHSSHRLYRACGCGRTLMRNQKAASVRPVASQGFQ